VPGYGVPRATTGYHVVACMYCAPPSYGIGGDYLCGMSSSATARIAVLLDFENVQRVGHGLYGRGKPLYQCVPEPVLVADLIARRRNVASRATVIRVFRGRPNPEFERQAASANDKQRQLWERRDARVRVHSHPLFYRDWPKGPPVEKGVDVALAIEAVRLKLQEQNEFDALVVFSSDNDLVPAIKLCFQLPGPAIEVACWVGANPLQDTATKLPWCHFLSEGDWRSVVRDWTGRV
jgi:NYN domain